MKPRTTLPHDERIRDDLATVIARLDAPGSSMLTGRTAPVDRALSLGIGTLFVVMLVCLLIAFVTGNALAGDIFLGSMFLIALGYFPVTARLTAKARARAEAVDRDRELAVTWDAETIRAIREGRLPREDSPVQMEDGEVCHVVQDATLLGYRTHTTGIAYDGFAFAYPRGNGAWKFGSFDVQRETEKRLDNLADGTLVLTNRYVRFLSPERSITLPIASITDAGATPESLAIAPRDGPVLHFRLAARDRVASAALHTLLHGPTLSIDTTSSSGRPGFPPAPAVEPWERALRPSAASVGAAHASEDELVHYIVVALLAVADSLRQRVQRATVALIHGEATVSEEFRRALLMAIAAAPAAQRHPATAAAQELFTRPPDRWRQWLVAALDEAH